MSEVAGQAGTTSEIEITPEMIARGVAVVREWEASADYSYDDLVRQIVHAVLSRPYKSESIFDGIRVNDAEADARLADRVERFMRKLRPRGYGAS